MTIADLIKWHRDAGLEAHTRAQRAQSHDCKLANQKTAAMHRQTADILYAVEAMEKALKEFGYE